MQHGDFTSLAKAYIHRPGYSLDALRVIGRYAGMDRRDFVTADIGAGTGKLTQDLASLGLTGFAVEPNDAMRAEGMDAFDENKAFHWQKGSAEATGLPSNCADWALMGSSFHWTDAPRAMEEFHRILKPGGFFTAIWNPRQIAGHALHEEIEEMIHKEIPDMNRVSSGAKEHVGDVGEKLLADGRFQGLFFLEADHEVVMSKERYLGVWRSVNDIQVQAGPERFQKIMERIEEIIAPLDEVVVYYKSRAWTVQAA